MSSAHTVSEWWHVKAARPWPESNAAAPAAAAQAGLGLAARERITVLAATCRGQDTHTACTNSGSAARQDMTVVMTTQQEE